jgi:DNA-binding CsgD family transcriptional regulator
VALGRTRDAEEVVRVAIAEAQRAAGVEPVALHLLDASGEVLQLVAEGKTAKEIGTILGLSTKTADAHRTRLMQKLDIHGIAGLTRYAIRSGLIQP